MRHQLLALTFVALTAQGLNAQTIAIEGGTVYPVSGPRIENGTVLIKDGRILQVGTSVTVPADATIIDAKGKWVTPGLFHAWTDLGLNEVGSVPQTSEDTKSGDINAAFNVAEGINPQSVFIPVARTDGVTTAVSGPEGGLVSGQALLLDLSGDRLEDLISQNPVAMVVDLSSESKGAGGGTKAGVYQRLRQLIKDADEYRKRTPDFKKNQMQQLSAPAADLEALQPVMDGRIPLYTIANRQSDIESVVRLAKEYHLKLVIRGGTEAWKVAKLLAAEKVPVVLNPLSDSPSFDGLSPRLDNATILKEAGVPVVLIEPDRGNYRNLRFSAGNAVRNGMKWDDALLGITLEPARAMGVESRYGSLETGKVANVVVWSGDPLDFASAPEHTYIRGVEISKDTRQTELLERYKTLPPKY
ncbi:MAG TPA: amidohydrolase family protein, partial [Gemmatimonadales bacterium]|nr:amidohydrolase family protein [Gemmatimonadales bacterium]